MEIDELAAALEKTVSYLRHSRESDWSSVSLDEMIESLEAELMKSKNLQPFDTKILDLLFSPTGPIQETAIDNGWGEKFLEFSRIVDVFTGKSN